MPTNLIERALKTIRHYDMLKSGDSVLVAVSGGPDSVFLLYVLDRLKKRLGISKICVAHLDHSLRGSESREDALFVKKLADSLGLKCISAKVDIRNKKVVDKELSTEEIARETRYKFFAEAAGKTGCTVIATGHTLDDQAETIIMRLIKGASLKGIVGIPPVREENGIKIIRPLFDIEKKEIARFLDEEGIPYRIDKTNLEPIYFRNTIRSEIIPFLEKYNPRLKRVLSNLAEHLREDFEFINEAKSASGSAISQGKHGAVAIELKYIVIQPKALQKEILRDMLEKAGGEVKKLTFRHWKELEHFIKYKRKGNSLDLPGGIRVTRKEDILEFERL